MLENVASKMEWMVLPRLVVSQHSHKNCLRPCAPSNNATFWKSFNMLKCFNGKVSVTIKKGRVIHPLKPSFPKNVMYTFGAENNLF